MQESGETPTTAVVLRDERGRILPGQSGDATFAGKRYETPALYPDSLEHEGLERVLTAVRAGDHGFEAACEAEGWPASRVVMWAIRDTPRGFKAAYREARVIESEIMATKMSALAAGNHRGEEKDTAGAVYRDQLLIKTNQWLLGKRDPGTFGDRGVVDETGKAVPKQKIVIGNMEISF